ncbi:hypothetical protein D3C74_307700 [compost metagenome]
MFALPDPVPVHHQTDGPRLYTFWEIHPTIWRQTSLPQVPIANDQLQLGTQLNLLSLDQLAVELPASHENYNDQATCHQDAGYPHVIEQLYPLYLRERLQYSPPEWSHVQHRVECVTSLVDMEADSPDKPHR